MGRRGARPRSFLRPARGPSPRARGVQSPAASPPRSLPRAAPPSAAQRQAPPGRPRRVGPPAALTLASGGRISTWLFSSSFFAASFCANAELNDTFTMAGPQRPARQENEDEKQSGPAELRRLSPTLPPLRCCLAAAATPVPLSGG